MATPPQTSAPPAPVAPGSAPPVIVFDSVSIGFDGKPVLNDISFQLSKGETKVIFGVAGAGKSTILKLALGLIKPDAGDIFVGDENIVDKSEDELLDLRRRVGIVFPESALFDSLTVRENVAFRLVEEGKSSDEEVEKRVREALSFVELENTMDLFPSELSGGMRRRVAIARAIITQPEILLYDSPTGGLDPVTSTTIVELIVKQRDVYQTSSLLVTHRLQDAFTMAGHYFDRKTNHMEPLAPHDEHSVPFGFLILRDGKVIFDGNVHELARSTDPYIREYIS